MELNETEGKILKDIWKDELKRNTVQKAITIASQADPEMHVRSLHAVLNGIESLVPDDEEE